MKTVLSIGAGPLQAPAIRKARALGFQVFAVDGNPRAVGAGDCDVFRAIDIKDQDACCRFAHEAGVDGVFTAATDVGVLTGAWIAEQLGLAGLRYATARRLKNKSSVRTRWAEAGVTNDFRFVEIDDLTKAVLLCRNVGFPLIVKPVDGSGSKGVRRVDRVEEVESAVSEALNHSQVRRAMAESFVEGSEYGVESFVIGSVPHVLAVMKKTMTKPPVYAELGHVCPSDLSPDIEMRLRAKVEQAIAALGIECGSVNMDVIVDRSGEVSIVDIGGRMGGNLIGSHIVPLSTGIDVLAAVVQAAVGQVPLLQPVHRRFIATRLLDFPPGVILDIKDLKAIQARPEVRDVVLTVEPGSTVRPYVTNQDACGYVVVEGSSIVDAEQLAREVRDVVQTHFVMG